MSSTKIRITLILVSVALILFGLFQVKRKDTDPFIAFCGCMYISCGVLLLIATIASWNMF